MAYLTSPSGEIYNFCVPNYDFDTEDVQIYRDQNSYRLKCNEERDIEVNGTKLQETQHLLHDGDIITVHGKTYVFHRGLPIFTDLIVNIAQLPLTAAYDFYHLLSNICQILHADKGILVVDRDRGMIYDYRWPLEEFEQDTGIAEPRQIYSDELLMVPLKSEQPRRRNSFLALHLTHKLQARQLEILSVLSSLLNDSLAGKRRVDHIRQKSHRLRVFNALLRCERFIDNFKKIALVDEPVLLWGNLGLDSDSLLLEEFCRIAGNNTRLARDFYSIDNQEPFRAIANLFGDESHPGRIENAKDMFFINRAEQCWDDIIARFLEVFKRSRKEKSSTRLVFLARSMPTEWRTYTATQRKFWEILSKHTLKIPDMPEMISDGIIDPAREIQECLQEYFGIKAHIAQETDEILQNWNWPDNFSEIYEIVHFIAATCTETRLEIGPQHLPNYLKSRNSLPSTSQSLEEVEKEHIHRVLLQTKGNRTKAAKILDISRPALIKKIGKYELANIGRE